LRGDLPAPLEHVIFRALEKNPQHRFQSAAEFRAALEQVSGYITTDSWAAVSAAPAVSHAPAYSAPGTPHSYSGPMHGQMAPASLGYGPVTPSGAEYSAVSVSPQKRNPLLWVALGGCGVLVLLGGLFFVFAIMLGTRAASKTVATEIEADAGVVETPTPTPTPFPEQGDGVKPSPITGDLDQKLIDVQKFLPKATELAQKQYPDAILVAIDAIGVTPGGVVDVSKPSNHVLYRFRSPKHSVPPPDHPSNVAFESECIVYVMARAGSLNSFVTRWQCDLPLLGPPKCSFADVWAKAQKKGAPGGNVVGTLGYNGDGVGDGAPTKNGTDKKRRWYVIVPPNFSAVFPDDC
jgi:hypothetical protein